MGQEVRAASHAALPLLSADHGLIDTLSKEQEKGDHEKDVF
jgi:hypothetical protein